MSGDIERAREADASTNVVSLNNDRGSLLCTISLSRRADGTIEARLEEMAPRLIETTGEEVADRVAIIARWLREGAEDMRRQAAMFGRQS